MALGDKTAVSNDNERVQNGVYRPATQNKRQTDMPSDCYFLPRNRQEQCRLDMQHSALCLTFGSPFPFKDIVEPVLLRNNSDVHILDVGTGSGKWALDVAQSYPSATVIGFDLVLPDLASSKGLPSNLKFEVRDAQEGLSSFETNTFNFVHVRSVDGGVQDQQGLIHSIARVLKPGGVLIIGTGGAQYYDENMKPFPFVEPGHPQFFGVQYITGQAYLALLSRQHRGVHGPQHYSEWLSYGQLWNNAQDRTFFIPLGPWKDDLTTTQVKSSTIMRANIACATRAFKTIVLSNGYEEGLVDEWITMSMEQLKEMRPRAYFPWKFSVATRSDVPWREEPLTPPTSNSSLILGIPDPTYL